MNAISPPSQAKQIQGLLTRLVDSVESLNLYADLVRSRELGDLLRDIADRRQERVEDLSWMLASHGMSPSRAPSRTFLIHSAWLTFIGRIITVSDTRFASESEAQDRKLAGHFKRASVGVDARSAHMFHGIRVELESDACFFGRFVEILKNCGGSVTRSVMPDFEEERPEAA